MFIGFFISLLQGIAVKDEQMYEFYKYILKLYNNFRNQEAHLCHLIFAETMS
jgi:hypothetical protein